MSSKMSSKMSSDQDYDFAFSLSTVNTQIPIIFSYFVPWIGLAICIFATVVLLVRKRTEDNQSLLIYIFQWQYAIGVVFWLNMIFFDYNFAKNLFGYNWRSNMPDIICKLVPMICKFLYCSSPWIQVVITFDRLWCVYLESKFKIKRKRLTVTILILIVFGFVFLASQVHLLYYQRMTATYKYVFNATLNKSVLTVFFIPICEQGNSQIVLAQDLIHTIMRIVLPFVIMVVCNVLLINHIRKSRKVAVSSAKEKKEQSFTFAVAIMNLSYLICNIGVVVYYIMLYYYSFSGSILDIVPYYINQVFGTSAILFSYVFTLSQFFIDLIFNKVFRKVIFSTVLHLSGRENKVSQSDSGNSQAQTQTAKKY